MTGTLKVITDNPATGTPLGDGDEHLGCVAADYGVLPPNSIAVIQRGFCTFVDKGAAAEAAGAVGVIVINRDDIADPLELPTFIGYTPSIFDIPMVGIGRGAKLTLQGSDGIGATLKAGPSITNATYLNNADFSSGGPRLGDNAQKPDVSAPGVNITSTAVGLGYKGDTLSGTSMASPHVAGVAALVHARASNVEARADQGGHRRHRGPVEGQPVQPPHRRVGHGPASSRGRHRRLRAGDGPARRTSRSAMTRSAWASTARPSRSRSTTPATRTSPTS